MNGYEDFVTVNGDCQVTCNTCGSVVVATMVETHFKELHKNVKPKKD